MSDMDDHVVADDREGDQGDGHVFADAAQVDDRVFRVDQLDEARWNG